MTDLLVFGADSLVGSHFVAATSHRVTAMGRHDPAEIGLKVAEFRPIDLLHPIEVEATVRNSSARVVVNFAGYTDVDAAEKERPASVSELPPTSALTLNALAPQAMARGSRATGKGLISLSTDFVFAGAAGPYPESAMGDPFSPRVSWYGWTKGEGERRIQTEDPNAAIVRIAYPYGHEHPRKLDFARRLLQGYRRDGLPPLFTDQQITPTWIPDVSRSLEYLLASPTRGVLHVASPDATTPFEFARALLTAEIGRVPTLREGTLASFLSQPRATPRPVRGGLACARLPQAGVSLTGWREGIERLTSGGREPP